MAGNSRTLIKHSCLLFVALGKGDFTLTAEQLEAIKCIYDGKDVFLWLQRESIRSRLCRLFSGNYKHSDGELVVVVA